MLAGRKRYASNYSDVDLSKNSALNNRKTNEESQQKLANVFQERSNFRKLKRLKMQMKNEHDYEESNRSLSPSIKFSTPKKNAFESQNNADNSEYQESSYRDNFNHLKASYSWFLILINFRIRLIDSTRLHKLFHRIKTSLS